MIGGSYYYEQQFGIATGSSNIVEKAGSRDDNSEPTVYYPFFVNSIQIGSESDRTPRSFDGYLKEFKLFDSFHSFAQIQDEKLKIMRANSFDDKHLVSYWKLTEEYSTEALQYTLKDYSKYHNELTYS